MTYKFKQNLLARMTYIVKQRYALQYINI